MVIGRWFYLAISGLAGILLGLKVTFLSLFLLLFITLRTWYEKQLPLFFLHIGCFTSCLLISSFHLIDNQSLYSSGNTTLQLAFQEAPKIDGDRLSAIVTTPQENFLLSYRIKTENEKTLLSKELAIGVECTVTGVLVRPSPHRNENAFDYQKYLSWKKIHWIVETDHLMMDSCTSNTTILSTLKQFRSEAIQWVTDNLPEEIIPYANALIFGERSFFEEELTRFYQDIGIIHLLAISGLHVSMVVGFLYVLLLRMGWTIERVFWLFLIILPIYAILAGANPPVVRAVLMTLILLTSRRWRIPLTSLDALSITFLLFMIVNPYLLFQAGFQLSFMITLMLILTLRVIHEASNSILSLIHTSVICSLSSFPILMFHFYEVSFMGIFANLLFVPFYSIVVLPMLFISIIILFVNKHLFTIISKLFIQLLQFSEKIAEYLSAVPFSTIVTGKPSELILILLIISLVYYFLYYHKPRERIFRLIPFILIFIIQIISLQYSVKGEIVFIDVGQGDSTLIKLPYNKGTYLVDTGGQIQFTQEEWKKRKQPFSVGENVLIPFLKSKGISKLDKLILTHSDFDHIGSSEELIEKIKIKEILISPNSHQKQVMKNIVMKAAQFRIPVKETKAGEIWQTKSAVFAFLSPFDEEYEGNNDSLVLYAEIAGLKWLFMGDVEREGEYELIEFYKTLDIDVLKAGHHGSNTSTTDEFLDMTTPRLAIVSAGVNNRYGHPHPEVMDRFERRGIAVLRTDEQGAIHFIFSKKSGTFRAILQ